MSKVRSILSECLGKILGKKGRAELNFKKRCYWVRKYGPEALNLFHKISEDLGFDYSLMYGSLLGSYREKGFIKNDDDIDLAMSAKDISIDMIQLMNEKGFLFKHAFVTSDHTALHCAFEFKKMKFDLYSYEPIENGKFLYGFDPSGVDDSWIFEDGLVKGMAVRVKIPFNGYRVIDFVGVKVKVFNDEDPILRILYGDNYMTPIRGAKTKPNENIIFEPLDKCYAYMIDLDTLREMKVKREI